MNEALNDSTNDISIQGFNVFETGVSTKARFDLEFSANRLF